MKKMMVVAFLFVAAGCVTTAEKYGDFLDSWVGVGELELVRKWGAPDKSYEVKGVKFLTFVSSHEVIVPGDTSSHTSFVIGGVTFTDGDGAPDRVINYGCETTFEIYKGKVVDWRFAGNDCAVYE